MARITGSEEAALGVPSAAALRRATGPRRIWFSHFSAAPHQGIEQHNAASHCSKVNGQEKLAAVSESCSSLASSPHWTEISRSRKAAGLRRRENRRPLGSSAPFLNLNFRKQHGRRSRSHRNLPGFSAANSVENLHGVSRHHNIVQGKQRRAHDIHSAHEFVRSAVGINAIYHHRQHLKGLRHRARSQCEAALNIVEIKAVRFSLLS